MLSTAFAEETQVDADLQTSYENVMSYTEKHGINLNMTYDDFLASYNGQSAQSYEQSFYPVFFSPAAEDTRSSGSSGSGNIYYYNTRFSCPSEATYSKYNLLDIVKKVM